MPPTRGHDLKLLRIMPLYIYWSMPPTRGHDLKQIAETIVGNPLLDAPHTGARLETR